MKIEEATPTITKQTEQMQTLRAERINLASKSIINTFIGFL